MYSSFRYSMVYLIVDVFCIILSLVVIFNFSDDSGSERQVRFFKGLLVSNLAFNVFDCLWALLFISELIPTSPVVLSIVNGMCLVAIAFSGFFWFCYTALTFKRPLTKHRLWVVFSAIPVAATVLVHILGVVLNQNLFIAEDNSISYGIAHMVILLISVLYLIAAAILSIQAYRKSRSSEERHRALIFASFLIMPALAAPIDVSLPNTPIAAASMGVSIVFVLMSLQESRISRDALTSLNNRRRTDIYLEDSLLNASEKQPVELYVIDMDGFKNINDQFGHLEGDRALQLMARALQKTSERVDAFAGRWGGDEFVLIRTRLGSRTPEEIIELVHENLTDVVAQADVPYKLACSVGYAETKSPQTTRSELVALADEMLYLTKRANRDLA